MSLAIIAFAVLSRLPDHARSADILIARIALIRCGELDYAVLLAASLILSVILVNIGGIRGAEFYFTYYQLEYLEVCVRLERAGGWLRRHIKAYYYVSSCGHDRQASSLDELWRRAMLVKNVHLEQTRDGDKDEITANFPLRIIMRKKAHDYHCSSHHRAPSWYGYISGLLPSGSRSLFAMTGSHLTGSSSCL